MDGIGAEDRESPSLPGVVLEDGSTVQQGERSVTVLEKQGNQDRANPLHCQSEKPAPVRGSPSSNTIRASGHQPGKQAGWMTANSLCPIL
ncbi:hypothetical protein JCM17960_01150 [Magnetospira thiophila]